MPYRVRRSIILLRISFFLASPLFSLGADAELRSFVCQEEIQRFRGDANGGKARILDRVSASLSFENGSEHYSDIRRNALALSDMSQIAGAWSEGEYGTLLQQTLKLLSGQAITFVSFDAVGSNQTAIYRFPVSEAASPWDLTVGARHYRVPFETRLWISLASGEILKIQRESGTIPAETGITQISWSVTLGHIELSGKHWLLPTVADYAVSYARANRREWNRMSFSKYRRYGSESVLKFD